MMKLFLIFHLLTLFDFLNLSRQNSPSYLAESSPISGVIYALGSNRSVVLGKIAIEEKSEGENVKNIKLKFLSPSDKPLVIENYRIKNGEPTFFSFEQKQTQDYGEMQVEDSEIVFNYKNEKTFEKRGSNLLVSANTYDFLKANWDSLMKGDPVHGRFALIHLKQTVEVSFFRDPHFKNAPKNSIVIKGSLSNWFQRWLADPIYFSFKADGEELLAYQGKIGIKQEFNGKFNDLEGEIVYDF